MDNFYKVIWVWMIKFTWLFGPCLFYGSELLRYLVQGYTWYIPFNERPDWAVVFLWNTTTIWIWCIAHYIVSFIDKPATTELVYE